MALWGIHTRTEMVVQVKKEALQGVGLLALFFALVWLDPPVPTSNFWMLCLAAGAFLTLGLLGAVLIMRSLIGLVILPFLKSARP